MSVGELNPAIEHLERKVDALVAALNVLRAEAGMPPYTPSSGDGGNRGRMAALEVKPDVFFNKRQHTAIREYLEMRQAHGLGPATPREIYQALKKGGFQYTARDDQVALVGLRSLLRRRTNAFIKVGDTGAYGLVSWYPEAKRKSASRTTERPDEASEQHDADDNESTAAEESSSTAA